MTKKGSVELVATRRLKRLLSDRPVVGAFFSSPIGSRLRKRLYQITPAEVERVGSALDRAGVHWFLAGGWGVDALVGRRTRYHGDLDLCVEVAEDGESKAVERLAELGYLTTVRRAPSGHRFPYRSVLRHSSGRTIDLILVTFGDTSPTDEDVPLLGLADRSRGEIAVGDRRVAVPCLSPAFQIELHCGYVPRDRDRRDVAVLCDSFGLTPPRIYRESEPTRPARSRIMEITWKVITRVRGVSAIVVPVPAADEVLDAVGTAAPGAMPAHVTIGYPFKAPLRIRQRDHDRLRAIAAAHPPCRLEMPSLAHDELVTFLTVHPEHQLRRIIDDVLEAWPEYPRYGDDATDVPPHLTVGTGVLPSEIAATVEPYLPLEVTADRLSLMVRGLFGRWRVECSYWLIGPATQGVGEDD